MRNPIKTARTKRREAQLKLIEEVVSEQLTQQVQNITSDDICWFEDEVTEIVDKQIGDALEDLVIVRN